MAKPEQLVNTRAPHVPVPSLDLLQSFAAATALPLLRFPPKGQEEQELGDEGLELSLGLSLNGRFRVNPGSSKLARLASISDVKSSLGGDFNCDGSNGFGNGMARTCSLPVENKGEIGGDKKRKDAMTWRRLEARRRKIEKLRDADPCETSNSSGASTRNGLIGSCLNGYDKTGVTEKSMTIRQQLVSQLSRRSGSLRTECLEIQGRKA